MYTSAVVLVATILSARSSTFATWVPEARQPGEVKSAMATVRQKKISARPACAVETGAGRKYITVRPPSSPCTMTAARATRPSRFNQVLDSASHSQAARMMVRKPTVLAMSRWPCS